MDTRNEPYALPNRISAHIARGSFYIKVRRYATPRCIAWYREVATFRALRNQVSCANASKFARLRSLKSWVTVPKIAIGECSYSPSGHYLLDSDRGHHFVASRPLAAPSC